MIDSLHFYSIGQNVEAATGSDGKLYLRLDPKADFGPSTTGKSVSVASTRGNIAVAGVRLGLNAYRPIGK
jgi:hypothetical protein